MDILPIFKKTLLYKQKTSYTVHNCLYLLNILTRTDWTTLSWYCYRVITCSKTFHLNTCNNACSTCTCLTRIVVYCPFITILMVYTIVSTACNKNNQHYLYRNKNNQHYLYRNKNNQHYLYRNKNNQHIIYIGTKTTNTLFI